MRGSKAFIDTSAILPLLIKDDPAKAKAVETLIREAKNKGINLYILPVTILEIVWVAEKVYHLSRKNIRELVVAILNTPELKCPLEHVFRAALVTYETKNIKLADAVLGHWGLEQGITTVYTYDVKDFKGIPGLQVLTPESSA